jgi:thiosulfate/3-mercaptopyruvate sulfurtransferase
MYRRVYQKSTIIAPLDIVGISIDRPIAVSCGSGVTACVLALVWASFLCLDCTVFIKQSSNNISIQGLHRIGKHDIPVYNGSWTEWEAQPDSNYPKVTATTA